MALYVMAYTAGRGWIEMLRIDDVEYQHVLGLRLNVWTSIVLFVAGRGRTSSWSAAAGPAARPRCTPSSASPPSACERPPTSRRRPTGPPATSRTTTVWPSTPSDATGADVPHPSAAPRTGDHVSAPQEPPGRAAYPLLA